MHKTNEARKLWSNQGLIAFLPQLYHTSESESLAIIHSFTALIEEVSVEDGKN
jgi:hypothetical protein